MADLREELQRIYEDHGSLTPEIVVQEARAKDHPLHDRVFDKTQKAAAEAYYRDRAHELITSVRITYKDADESGGERTVRAFHAVQTPEGHVYEPVEKVADDEFTRRIVLNTMEREWRQLFNRYEQFQEFLSMVEGDLSTRRAA